MERKEVKQLENKINNILENREKDIAALEEKIDSASNQLCEANRKMEEATCNGDLKAYQEAKNVKRNAEDAMEMYNKKLNSLKYKALISTDEYDGELEKIMNALDEVSDNAQEQIFELVEQIKVIGEECQEIFNQANSLIYKWQNTVYRNKDITIKNSKGEPVIMNHLRKRYENYIVPQFASYIVKSGYYENIKKTAQ